MSDPFVLSEDNVLYYVGTRPLRSYQQQEDAMLRLVVPSTMIQEVLQNCHDSLEGGHQGIAWTFYRVKLDYYMRGTRSCPTVAQAKVDQRSVDTLRGGILAERPFQVVSMDFVIHLPKARWSNTALLLFQCAFTGYVMGKAMANTTALRVAQAFEECVYRRFGVPSLIRHDRDPRFMSDVFQSFTEMMQSRSRATLSYRPQANGQQERSVKTCVYAEDPLQQDWDEIAEKLIFAINNSMDAMSKETPFFLVHGWDAQSTLKAMSSSLKR
ncbi:reverse transcriptase [Phytophthora megakarya]|uniref:Reverse transcriptase n=1 Tax=Phytophthora megakarya TaxID=4795 RepID=A0A225VG04_9STRA|nr:reverse transcriptase [Phytophthora megakarya]